MCGRRNRLPAATAKGRLVVGLKLSIDSGGTKMCAVLFDDQFQFVASGRGGSANTNFDSAGQIAAQIDKCLAPILAACAGQTIERVYVTSLGTFDEFIRGLRGSVTVREAYSLSEGQACLRAGMQRRRGTVAIAGTGAIAIGVHEHGEQAIGGWGSWIGDEGSGYDIGRRAIGAAIRDVEGRGPQTKLTEAIVAHFGLTALHDLFTVLYSASSVRSFIASASPLVSQAAHDGDPVARAILVEAGTELGGLVLALRRREPALRQYPITVSGSVWRGSRLMFDSFVGKIQEEEPAASVEFPRYEPVMGGVIEEALQAGGSIEGDADSAGVDENVLRAIDARFEKFVYRTEWASTDGHGDDTL